MCLHDGDYETLPLERCEKEALLLGRQRKCLQRVERKVLQTSRKRIGTSEKGAGPEECHFCGLGGMAMQQVVAWEGDGGMGRTAPEIDDHAWAMVRSSPDKMLVYT